MQILNGKEVSREIKENLNVQGKLKLVVIQVGNDEASNVYIKSKKTACETYGINFEHLKFEEDVKEELVINAIKRLNEDDEVTGILLQLPIPKHLDATKIINTIDYKKDVDGLTNVNAGKLVNNEDCLISCTPLGIIKLLERYNIDIASKNVVIVGRSNLVGKPLINLFLNKDATVSVCHSKTKNLSDYTKNADILVIAVGKKHLIDVSMVKEGAVVIDVGINRIDGKLYGDVDFDSVKDKASFITPVPGGVGPMTVSMLLYNVKKAGELQKNNIKDQVYTLKKHTDN